jgi:histone deacetylase 1/2
MRLDKELAKIACELDSQYNRFVRADGSIVVKLLKALYGCVQSSKVWYDTLTQKLGGMGYQMNPQDPCVFNKKNRKGDQVSIVIHVDDIMITTQGESNLDLEIQLIEKEFGELTVSRGKVLNYLGMNFDFGIAGEVKITMNGFIEDIINDMNGVIDGIKDTPATRDLFKIGESELINDEMREFYHSTVARLLYLAKRARPDLLLAISYLAKRVQQPNEQDYSKLERVIKYLRGSSSMGIILKPDKILHIIAWIDASHAVHGDHKSHSGTIISLGKGPIYQKSGTQRINTKSSTESEIVALSDNSSQVIWSRNFLIGQGYQVEPALIYQDNTSTMSLVKNGKSNSERTKHIATRFYFVKDRVDCGELRIEYMKTDDMIADILTKPLTGALFIKMRALLMNWPLN